MKTLVTRAGLGLIVIVLLAACGPSCEPVDLMPTDGQFVDVPAYEGASQSTTTYTLDYKNDPNDRRCELAWVFDGDLSDGAEWKHYVTTDSAEDACDAYADVLSSASWRITLEFCSPEDNFLLGKHSGLYLLVLFLSEGETTDILVGRGKD